MPFDLSTAKPVQGGFDPSTARPIQENVPRETAPEDVPQFGPTGEIIKPEVAPVERTMGEKLGGAGETGLSLLTGATGGTAGMIYGTFKGLADAIRSGQYGTDEGADLVEKTAMEMANKFTYEPKSEAGRTYTKATAEFLTPLQAVAPLVQEINMATAGLKGAQIPKIAKPSTARQIAQTAEQQGITPMTSDVFPPKTFVGKLGQSVTERIPVIGTGPVRATQQTQRANAVRNLLTEYGATEAAAASDDVMLQLLKKRGGLVDKYTGMKGNVISKLSEKGAVPVDKTIQAIDKEITKLQSLKTEGVSGAISILEDYKNSFQNQNLSNIELLRKQLGEQFNDPGLAGVKTTAQKSLNNIYRAVNNDMGNFIKNTGESRDFSSWKLANNRLSGMMDEMSKTTLKTVLAKGDATPETVRRMLFSQKPSDIKLLYKNLTPEGRANARTAIFQEVISKAGGIDNLSPERFLQIMKRMDKPVDVFFGPQDKKALNGLIDSLNYTKQASVAGVKPPTGAELTAFATPTGLSWLLGGDPTTGLIATGGVGLIARAYESAPVRNLLIRISETKGDIGPLVNQLNQKLTTMAAKNAEIGALAGAEVSGVQQ